MAQPLIGLDLDRAYTVFHWSIFRAFRYFSSLLTAPVGDKYFAVKLEILKSDFGGSSGHLQRKDPFNIDGNTRFSSGRDLLPEVLILEAETGGLIWSHGWNG